MLGRTRRRIRARFLGDAGGAPVLIQGPVADFYASGTGLIGRVTESGASPYDTVVYGGVVREGFTVTSGRVQSTPNASSPQEIFAYVERSADRMWVRTQHVTDAAGGMAANQRNIAHHITTGTGTATWMFGNGTSTTGLVTDLGIRWTNQANTTNIFGAASDNAQHLAGDFFTVRYEGLLGGSPTAQLYINGQAITDPAAIVTATVPITHRYGFRGASAANFDSLELISPVDDRSIELIIPGRIVQRNSNGDIQMSLTFRAYPDLPSASNLRYSFINAATGVAVTGHDEQPISNYAASPATGVLQTDEIANVARCTTGLMLSADVPATFYVELKRTDVTVGTISKSRSPILRRGNVICWVGQSISQQMWAAAGTAGSGQPNTAPTNRFCFDATNQYGSADLDIDAGGNWPRVRQTRRATTSNAGPTEQFAGVLQALTGGLPVMMGMGGWGGTLQAARNNLITNPTYRERLLVGLANAHCKLSYIIDTSGQFELNDPTNSANGGPYYGSFREAIDGRVTPSVVPGYEAQVIAEQDAIDLLCGPTVRMMCPVNVQASPDANQQELRRIQAVTMPANYPTRFVRGPYTATAYRNGTTNSSTGDIYHLSATSNTSLGHANCGYGIQARDHARRVAHLLDPIANPSDFNGPIMLSAVIASGTTIEVTFDPNGGTLAFRNGTYLGDYRGGLDFLTVADSTDFNTGNAIYPTNCTVTGNVATFTFASVPATVYICSHRGSNPFSRGLNVYTRDLGAGGASGTDAVFLDMPNRASMICSEYTGAEFNDFGTTTTWRPVQPYWNTGGANGTDYVTAV